MFSRAANCPLGSSSRVMARSSFSPKVWRWRTLACFVFGVTARSGSVISAVS